MRPMIPALFPAAMSATTWLELLLPSPAATRWMLLGDLACLVVLVSRARRRLFAVPSVFGGAFVVLNVLGMAANDFYIGLALFHPIVGATTILATRPGRWLGAGLVACAAILGPLT